MSSDHIEVGIIGIEYQLPQYRVSQKDVAKNINCEYDKLKIGLDLLEMGVPGEREDAVSLALSATKNLIQKYGIDTSDVGKIEVGSESNFDAAKSIKSYIMQLFDSKDISGCDNINACYGGTNALLNSLAWLESSFCTKRYAIVVCTDICVYEDDSARPTSGAGAVAILLGKNPVFAFVKGQFSHYSSNEGDFIKPRDKYPYPVLNAKKSIDVYIEAFNKLNLDISKISGRQIFFDHIVCHTPYPKLVKKVCKMTEIPESMCSDSLLACRMNGNTYTASLYFSLISLLYSNKVKIDDTICIFSFGSGCVASMFCLKKIRDGCLIDDLEERLNQRELISYQKYLDICQQNLYVENVGFKGIKVPSDERYYISSIEGYVRYYEKNTQ